MFSIELLGNLTAVPNSAQLSLTPKYLNLVRAPTHTLVPETRDAVPEAAEVVVEVPLVVVDVVALAVVAELLASRHWE